MKIRRDVEVKSPCICSRYIVSPKKNLNGWKYPPVITYSGNQSQWENESPCLYFSSFSCLCTGIWYFIYLLFTCWQHCPANALGGGKWLNLSLLLFPFSIYFANGLVPFAVLQCELWSTRRSPLPRSKLPSGATQHPPHLRHSSAAVAQGRKGNT